MNIFVLDYDIQKCAEYHCDKHVVKMILEYAQLLSTVHRQFNPDAPVYKPTHLKHPCTIWCMQSADNYNWLYQLFRALSSEITHRYGTVHKSWMTLNHILSQSPVGQQSIGLTQFAQAMPIDCKRNDAVEAYREYYRVYKSSLHKWTNRKEPPWLNTLF